MTTPDDLVPLDHVYFTGPVPLHGRLVREINRGQPMQAGDGTLAPGWEPHLHDGWGCVVVSTTGEEEGQTALVPLHAVRSMVLTPSVVEAKEPGWVASACAEAVAARKGRPRTKRLDLVRQ